MLISPGKGMTEFLRSKTMRACLFVLSLTLAASPALAQAKPAPTDPPETIVVPPELTDPAMADRLEP